MNVKFIVIDYSTGSMVGAAETEEEAREQLDKCCKGLRSAHSYILAEVRVLSQMKRVES